MNNPRDHSATAAYIAGLLPELSDMAHAAGHDVLGYLLGLAQAEARELCLNLEQPRKIAQN